MPNERVKSLLIERYDTPLKKFFKDYNFAYDKLWLKAHMEKLWTHKVLGLITWLYVTFT
jgi:hypothetical protein